MKLRISSHVIALCLILLATLSPSTSAAEPVSAPSSETPISFSLPDVHGRNHTAADFANAKAAVFFFIAGECPISNRYAPEINAIVAEYSKLNVAFFAIHSEPDVERDSARKHAVDYGYQLPVLLDPTQILAARLGVSMTPTVAIITREGKLLYRGRIDNRYLDFGTFRNTGISSDLRRALDNVLKGLAIEMPFTKTIGCAIPSPHGRTSSLRVNPSIWFVKKDWYWS